MEAREAPKRTVIKKHPQLQRELPTALAVTLTCRKGISTW